MSLSFLFSSQPPSSDANMIFCEKNNGETFTLPVGFKGVIELKGNPTTGFSWRTQSVVGNSVEFEKWNYVPDVQVIPMVGSGGIFKLPFTVKEQGMTTIYLVYDSPFHPKPFGYQFFLKILTMN